MTIASRIDKLSVILAEDDAFLRKVLRSVLIAIGIKKIWSTENGAEAIELLGAHKADLLVTDIQMPKMNGLELMKYIRTGDAGCPKDLRIIAITSFSTPEVVVTALSLGVNGFLVKPITPGDALQKINIAMSEKFDLLTSEAYTSVITDLESIQKPLARGRKNVNAAISLTTRKAQGGITERDREIPLSQLKPGMQLQSDLVTKAGLTLVSAGQVLDERLTNRIAELAEVIDSKYVLIV
ncbi:MAG: response regulator [Candidatus Thiodiazotropha taylori]|nr:response regulator [Candidatus Thiodiazotropha taylori]